MKWFILVGGLGVLAAMAAPFAFVGVWQPWLATEAVRADLRDGASARFRNVEAGDDGWICGEVNGKNGYGAYAGFTAFRARASDGRWEADVASADDPYPSAFTLSCGPSYAARATEHLLNRD